VAASSTTRKRLVGLRHDAQVELALRRLARFVRLEREYGAQLNHAGLRLLRACTFSAYCECRRLGVAAQAAAILAAERVDEPPPRLRPGAAVEIAS